MLWHQAAQFDLLKEAVYEEQLPECSEVVSSGDDVEV
jgi:hypothetical protein